MTVRFGFNERKRLIRVFGLCSASVRRPEFMINFDVLPRAYQAIALQQVAYLQQWRPQDFSMGGVLGTSHRGDVKILRHHDVTSLAVSI